MFYSKDDNERMRKEGLENSNKKGKALLLVYGLVIGIGIGISLESIVIGIAVGLVLGIAIGSEIT